MLRKAQLEGSTIMLALEAKPDNKPHDDLRPLALDMRLIGDAKEPGLIRRAVQKEFYATYYL